MASKQIGEVQPASRAPQPFREIAHRLPNHTMHTILDVGANLGQSSTTYAKLFPDADIWFFEPVPESFARASDLLAHAPRVRGINKAVSDRDASVKMSISGTSASNRVIATDGPRAVEIESIRLDSFAMENGIKQISFLKIDVEGHELSVLDGAREALGRTDFVQLELGMNLENTFHVPFSIAVETMNNHGFSVFLVCKQMFERDFPHLNRSDTVFINRSIQLG